MTDISKLGEFGLIHHLTDNIKIKNESTVKGVGDDCAVLHYPDSEVLVTTDMLMEGVHFDLTYIDLQHLGYKSAMVNISDIFAMNGTPRQLTVSIALSKRFKVEDIEEFYSGLRMACDKWGVDIVGGDTTSSYTGLAISITCIGEARKEDIVYRNGAKDTDLICVTGDLGAAYMGLQLLEREKSVYYQQVDEARKKNDKRALEELKGFQPDFAVHLLNLLVVADWHGEEQFVVLAAVEGARRNVHVQLLSHHRRLIVDRYVLLVDAASAVRLLADVHQFA